MGAYRRFRKASPAAILIALLTAAPAARGDEGGVRLGRGVTLDAYVQGQYESHQDSEDELRQGALPLNQDRFLVRRARLRLTGEWNVAAAILELDGNTVLQPAFGIRTAEAILQYRLEEQGPPLAAMSIGLMSTPFGLEVPESQRDRVFMERSLMSRAFWPGEQDVGLRVYGGLKVLRWSFAALNGEPLDERNGFPGRDPNVSKDVVVRLGAEIAPTPRLQIAFGMSALRGKGLHPGSDATKPRVDWRDLNEDGAIQTPELAAVPASAAMPSASFERWAVGVHLGASYRSALGVTSLRSEAYVAQNMDRGLFVADPVATGTDSRELGAYVAAVQTLGRYGMLGFRYDLYDPNLDVLDKRSGRLVPFSQRIHTLAPLVGLVLPPHARLTFQYDVIRDSLAKDARGVPTDLANDTWTLRLLVHL
ncbi:hypothetical protein BH11MYX4_BH11MYX4_64360 [soil metagenome]